MTNPTPSLAARADSPIAERMARIRAEGRMNFAKARGKVERSESFTPIGQAAKAAVAQAVEAGQTLPRNAQGLAAARIARGADVTTIFAALVVPAEPTPVQEGDAVRNRDDRAVPDPVVPTDLAADEPSVMLPAVGEPESAAVPLPVAACPAPDALADSGLARDARDQGPARRLR